MSITTEYFQILILKSNKILKKSEKLYLNSINIILYPQILAVYYKLRDIDFFKIKIF